MTVNGKVIARVFPRRTKATPDDELAFVDCPPPMLAMPEIDEVHISVTFTYDMCRAEELARQWKAVGVPVMMGGPALGKQPGEFEPGLYLKKGYVFTSRGCPNQCSRCMVPQREGPLQEIEIKDGWNVLDNNLIACSDEHFSAVIEMLRRQPERPLFTGGIEARRLKSWQAELMKEISTKRLYCAYDTPGEYEPLVEAGKILRDAGFTVASHAMCCYILIGYRGDTFEKADKRLWDTVRAGFVPYAMLYRDDDWVADDIEWRRFQRTWLRPEIIGTRMREIWPPVAVE